MTSIELPLMVKYMQLLQMVMEYLLNEQKFYKNSEESYRMRSSRKEAKEMKVYKCRRCAFNCREEDDIREHYRQEHPEVRLKPPGTSSDTQRLYSLMHSQQKQIKKLEAMVHSLHEQRNDFTAESAEIERLDHIANGLIKEFDRLRIYLPRDGLNEANARNYRSTPSGNKRKERKYRTEVGTTRNQDIILEENKDSRFSLTTERKPHINQRELEAYEYSTNYY
eukprot:TRINITY_DN498_c0_g1_i1.p1 TRINITY_DN498_c0_g1~~TRINITY_DN498_c0_g1_i1.p1  ORF type:complete len:223 (+),score=41.99 TRINITY_DN498_c0_g1_i1:291-959(+)